MYIIQESRHFPFGTSPTRPVRLQSCVVVAPRKCHGVCNALKVCGNPKCRAECGALYCDILSRSPSAISIQQVSNELNCGLHVQLSCTEVVLNGIAAFPNRLTQRATAQ